MQLTRAKALVLTQVVMLQKLDWTLQVLNL